MQLGKTDHRQFVLSINHFALKVNSEILIGFTAHFQVANNWQGRHCHDDSLRIDNQRRTTMPANDNTLESAPKNASLAACRASLRCISTSIEGFQKIIDSLSQECSQLLSSPEPLYLEIDKSFDEIITLEEKLRTCTSLEFFAFSHPPLR